MEKSKKDAQRCCAIGAGFFAFLREKDPVPSGCTAKRPRVVETLARRLTTSGAFRLAGTLWGATQPCNLAEMTH
jgi:hypothetical protein